ncbi:bile acid:sodium symporter family protein [Novosphingobium bradum]|uniref:Bile acid:sodium symporter family protein n=1 Tax=Novosphingobium bradum TaxID=1737444 RepID=A0ABV7IL20_9SPHN
MIARLRGALDPFIVALLGVVALASVLPARGAMAGVVDLAANAGIVLLFFLHGAKLSREAILAGAGNWRLHLAVLGTTFLAFPLLGLAMAAIPGIPPLVGIGLLFLTLLPSTVQSSIAFTSIAGGNVAAAVCSASFSNLIGIVVTPLLASALMGQGSGMAGGISLGAVEKIMAQLLAPFVIGHLARPLIGAFVSRHRQAITLVDRGSILLVVYSAFGAAVVGGLWHRLPPSSLVLILGLCCALLALVLGLTWALGRAFKREDAIVLLFCGSKKSLASGVPIARVLFPAAQVGALILPVMLFHQIQLIACAFIARALSRSAGARVGAGTSGDGAR